MRRLLKTAIVVLALVLTSHMPVFAGPAEDAAAAWNKQDYATAARLYRSLAEQGNASAQHFLGKMYQNGEGVPRDTVQAAKWFRLAADQGHTGAQFYLGGMYATGEGVPRDYVQAYKWFAICSKSAEGAFAEASRNDVAAKMTPQQIAAAQRLASEWKPTKAN